MESMNKNNKKYISRRSFLSSTAKAAVGITVLPSHVISGLGHKSPSDKLNIPGIGIGGHGRKLLNGVVGQNIVALCDIDWDYAGPIFKKYPKAKKWKDYREMLNKQKDIDGVMIATPDHTHALPSMIAMQLGKHVYVEKPLGRSVWEARQLKNAAKKYNVATQMGHEGHSNDSVRRVGEYIWSGAIGEIKEVHAWTDRPSPWWPQGIARPDDSLPVPNTLEWDLFVGPAPMRPYHPVYTPWNWRGWWDYGTGALGDMGSHILDVVFYALKLQPPISIQASSTPVYIGTLPSASRIEYLFPPAENNSNSNSSETKVIWYDGGLLPSRPDELSNGEPIPNVIFVGTKGKLVCGGYGSNFKLLPLDNDFAEPEKSVERIPDHPLGGDRHMMDWVRACKESPENRRECASNFEYASPFSEILHLGNLAIKLQDLNRKFIWNEKEMKVNNIQPGETIRLLNSRKYNRLEGNEGKPARKEDWEKLNALNTAQELIKPTFRDGWNW